MEHDDHGFVGSVPEIYDELMVPMFFAEPAALLAGEVRSRRPRRVLETAAGTGVLTEQLLQACPDAEVVATDLNQPMLDRAAHRLGPDPRLRLQQADALDLPFDDATFDVVACQFGAMFFPDRVRGYREALRVLRPGGALVFSVWDCLAANDFARVTTEAVNRVAEPPLDFMAQLPHGYFDPDQIRADLASAGLVVTDLRPADAVSVSTARDAAVALCQGTPLRPQLDAHPDVGLEQATGLARDALADRYGADPIRGRIRWLEVGAERPTD